MENPLQGGAAGGQTATSSSEGAPASYPTGTFDVEDSNVQALRDVADEVERIERSYLSSAQVDVRIIGEEFYVDVVDEMPGQD